MAPSDLSRTPSAGLRVVATTVALLAGYFTASLLLRGQTLAPSRALLGAFPAAPIALVHAVLLVADAWWPARVGTARTLLLWLVLLGGMLLVALGTDAAAAQFQRLGWRSFVQGHALPLGALVAVQGALGVLQVWARRAATK